MDNKRSLWILLIALAALLIIGFVSYWLFAFIYVQKPAPSSSTPSLTNPFGGGSNVPITTQPSSNPASTTSMTIAAYGGGTVTTNDFVHASSTIPDVQNQGSYLLAGSLGYCLPDMRCSAATSTDFNIGYDSTTQSFTIALIKEPIGKSRQEAEQFLLETLGITQAQLCSLNYYVGTTYWVNSIYDDRNLGFSFCPSATALPDN